MKELEKSELVSVEGGNLWTLWAPLWGTFLVSIAYELATEGFQQCVNDFKKGFNETYESHH